jgi:8-oxo-dGTP pyrophosphatase MutT (NUDIX family)
MTHIEFRGRQIPVTAASPADAEAAINTDLFKNWLTSLDPTFDLTSVTIQSVDHFSPTRIGFVKLSADITQNGVRLPGVVCLGGNAVGVLLVITDSDTAEQYTILVQQPRVPIGKVFLEIPAGMTDGSGNIRGVAIRELEEECGLVAKSDHLVNMCELASGGADPGVRSMPGSSDGFIVLFLWRITMSHNQIIGLEGRLGGEDSHEQITLRVVKLCDVWKRCPDCKTLSALSLYHNLISLNLI